VSSPEPEQTRGLTGRLYSLLPSALRTSLDRNPELRRVVFNINWLFSQRIFEAALGFVVGIAVLRYLGPEQFGVLSYVGAMVGLAVPFSMLGLNNVVVRHLVTREEATGSVLGTAVGLRFIATIVSMAVVLAATAQLRREDPTVIYFAGLLAAGHVLGVPAIVGAWFRANVNAKYTVFARSGAKTALALAKLGLIVAGAPLLLFVVSIPVELALATLLLLVFYHRQATTPVHSFSFRASEARAMLRESWPLTLSGLMTTIYLRADQVMLGEMLGDREVGIYAAAVRFSSLLYLIPGVVAGSVFPSLVKARDRDPGLYERRFQLLYDGLFWLSTVAAGSVTLIAPTLVFVLFGPDYGATASVVVIHVWSSVFMFIGTASQQFLVAEQLTRITLFSTVSGALINLAANAALIPGFGVNGAAYATLASMSVSHLLAMAVFPRSRKTLRFVLSSMNPFGVVRRWRALRRSTTD
jgi:PST family polysaccharide transporter